MNENITPVFGAIEQKQKQSDITLGSVVVQSQIPKSYFPKDYGLTIEWQHQIPACGSHAGNEVAEIFNVIESGKFTRLSPMYLWKRIKQIDGFKPEDGTSMEAIFKTLKNWGVCEFSLMGNDTLGSLTKYTDPSVTTKEMDDNAAKYKIESYAMQWSPTFDDIKRAIYNHKAVIGLLRVGAEWWTPSWKEKDILPLNATMSISSGHFITFYAYDEHFVYFYNHWSDTWGRLGIGYFGTNYASRCVQIGTAIDLTKVIFTAVLKFGSKGSDVSLLQKKLNSLGFNCGKVDGEFGKTTEQAVKNFQTSKGLKADGIVGNNTNKELSK